MGWTRGTVAALTLPYQGIVVLTGVLTLPGPLRGLQPVDGWIMLVAYGAHLAQAVSRGRTESDDGEWSNREIGPAIAGLAVLVAGAYVTVVSTERIVADPGISNLLGGLFITAPIGVAPEVFGT